MRKDLELIESRVKKIQEYYNLRAEDFEMIWGSFYLFELLETFLACIKQHGDHSLIFDNGCGSGRDSIYFAKNGYSTVGLDISSSMLKIAKRKVEQSTVRTQINLLNGDMTWLPFRNEVFHGVWCCASLLFTSQTKWEDILTSLYCILKKQGILFLAVKNLWSPKHLSIAIRDKILARNRLRFGETISRDERHITFISFRHITKLLKKARFKVLGGKIGLTWINLFACKV